MTSSGADQENVSRLILSNLFASEVPFSEKSGRSFIGASLNLTLNSRFRNHNHRKYRQKVTAVNGTVMAQYKLNCGIKPTPIPEEGDSAALSHSNMGMENRAETKLPGKKNMVTMASVFIEDESR